jgi:hypothetical protein
MWIKFKHSDETFFGILKAKVISSKIFSIENFKTFKDYNRYNNYRELISATFAKFLIEHVLILSVTELYVETYIAAISSKT